MGILSATGKAVTSVINIRVDHWLGARYIKESLGHTSSTIKNLFRVEQNERSETFAESLERLNITESDLAQREIEFSRLFGINLLLAIVIFCYAMYLFFNNQWGSGFMTFCLVLYPLSQAFKFHFWLFQIHNKKLGCTIQEWWQQQ